MLLEGGVHCFHCTKLSYMDDALGRDGGLNMTTTLNKRLKW